MDWKNVALDHTLGLPLYILLADAIRERIRNGELAPGERIPVSRKLQEVFRLSSITVENGIAILVKEGWLLRRPRLGTFVVEDLPVSGAVSVPSSSPRYVKVLFSRINPYGDYWLKVLFELQHALQQHGFELVLRNYEDDPSSAAAYLMTDSAGAVLCGTNPLAVVQLLRERHFPLVLFGAPDMDSPLNDHLDIAMGDDVANSYLSMKHLVSLGHRRITAFCAPTGTRFEADQLQGVRKAQSEFGLSDEQLKIVSAPQATFEQGEQLGAAELCREDRSSAFFVDDPVMASGILKAATKLGLRIPQDLSIVTTGSALVCKQTTPQLTSVETADAKRDMVQTMVQRLCWQIEGHPHTPAPLVGHKGKIVFRESTAFYQLHP